MRWSITLFSRAMPSKATSSWPSRLLMRYDLSQADVREVGDALYTGKILAKTIPGYRPKT